MRILVIAMVLMLCGCPQVKSMPTRRTPQSTADELFQKELASRGLTYAITAEGLYEIHMPGEITATINLENVRRDYERAQDPGVITRFATQLDGDAFAGSPSWPEVRPFVRYCLEPSDYGDALDDTLHERETDELVRIYVYTPPDGSRISWIANSMLADWQIKREDIVAQAQENMDRLVAAAKLEPLEVGDVQLGMVSIPDTSFKASLILSPKFRDLVAPTHGWPVYVVIPARDFVYVISEKNRGFLGRLGPVVLKEYQHSGHPISQEVFEVNDGGLKAIGTFGKRDSSE